MAKKLPKKELEKMKVDFDPPTKWKAPPGQMGLFDEDGNGAQQRGRKGRKSDFIRDMERGAAIVERRMDDTKKKAGRPRKHTEKGRSVSFWMTDAAIRKLRTEAAARGMTAPDLLHELIEGL